MMSEKKDYLFGKGDFEKAVVLLDVINKSKDWPAFQAIYGDAMRQLQDMITEKEMEDKDKYGNQDVKIEEDKSSKVEDEKTREERGIKPAPLPPILPGQPDPRNPAGSLSPPVGFEPSTGRITPPVNPGPGQTNPDVVEEVRTGSPYRADAPVNPPRDYNERRDTVVKTDPIDRTYPNRDEPYKPAEPLERKV